MIGRPCVGSVKMSELNLSEEQLQAVSERFRVLSDPMRLRILHQLQAGEKTVSELVEATGASQPNVSKHLSILRTAGLVNRRQCGNLAYFSIGAPFVFDLCAIVCEGIRQDFATKQAAFK